MIIRKLQVKDASQFWSWLISLQEQPEAFGASYAEEKDIPMKDLIAKFSTTVTSNDSFILGAFGEKDIFVGIVGLWRIEKSNFHHKA